MNLSVKRINAIFQKDLKDISKNIFVLSTVLIPFLFAFLYGRQGDVPLEVQFLIINIAFTAVGAFVQSAVIAEEKEKNTLRGLMMSPATSSEILTGKSLLSAVLTVVTMIVCLSITNYVVTDPIMLLSMIIALIFFISLGTLVGLMTKSLMEASVVSVPIIFVFGMGRMFQELFQGNKLVMIFDYLPNVQLEMLASQITEGASFAESLPYLGTILAWTLISIIVTVIVYNKSTLDA
ncbi:ABC transporter permease [Tenuibacillus multivorans]|uniref:ABC-2 type transport system permease protein n=1 Tax=Tenuibacillus multivorans TaxID=237069 RepID=A0A1H0DXS0_9BACI|nr:ABC transporter permease [Tenuibacillus multivorans]GEL76736.1 ABC transporter permease [Tenuibacillus multivorans]SDN74915.1 ABC-2 type transport system permease protein [Tenuibacillus multivorans]